VFHSRGAYLLAMGNVISASIRAHPVYLWSLPMFHCNGWCFTWTISVVAGTHVCLRRVNAANMFEACAKYNVTHMCGAPIVMSMLVDATDEERRALKTKVEFMTAAAPPPAATLARMEAAGFQVHHVYGLTETYGPAVVNAWHSEWDAEPMEERARIKARQGVRYPVLEALAVKDPETMKDVERNGQQMGEVFFRGNVVMKGYLKNPAASEAAFKGGWFHSGDLGVWHPEHLVDRGGGRADEASCGGACGCGGQARSKVGRNSGGVHRAEEGRKCDAGRDHRLRSRPDCRLQGTAHSRVLRTAQDVHGQDPEIQAPRDGPQELRPAAAPPQNDNASGMQTAFRRRHRNSEQ
jgi:fatty-acyl-CoA synthase